MVEKEFQSPGKFLENGGSKTQIRGYCSTNTGTTLTLLNTNFGSKCYTKPIL